MNLGQVRAAITRNKIPIGLGAAGVVAVLALRARAKTGTDTAPLEDAGYAAGYQTSAATGAATGYDSTASDVYGAIQPQLEYLQRLYEDWDAAQAATPPTPVPAQPAPSAAAKKDYGDTRRNAIAALYRSILGREPDLSGLNAQDRSGLPLAQLRVNILNSAEAKMAK